ncbi:class I SAM-dependent methyltransferase [Halorubrum sp. AD140]|uniref:class I SAM-dependent methyltransferase n=1 Tax=Halorubrum sp. AD140 TaxID=3050073 RepID=UPI002ACCC808|nr:class I SAM-dependent methyltransferase [Halorubrum sp. AD140]MDZ5809972.1 class I SAM-dependent methyltransferase [Halorubrum sp. AD140]
MYWFGLYHWRRRFRALGGGIAVALGGAVLWRRRSDRPGRALAGVAVALGTGRVLHALSTLASPPPWRLERYKYDALARELPLDGARRVLDVGCGTGRSLVGLAPWLPRSATLVGVDVFDDRVILGNGPRLARRNARLAGIAAEPVRGDAGALPFASGSFDVVTACRVLHDLPAERHDVALAELRRICGEDGTLGLLELPIAPDAVDVSPERYWQTRVTDAGLAIRTIERVPRRGGGEPYVVLVATPA